MSESNEKQIRKSMNKAWIYLVLIAILCITVCIFNVHLIAPVVVLYALLVIYTVLENRRTKMELTSHIEELTMDVTSAGRNNLVNSPIPLVIIQTDGNIIWRSKKFTDVFSDVEDVNTYLTLMVKEVKLEIENNDIKEFEKTLTINDRTYKVRGSVSDVKQKGRKKTTSEYELTLYLLDDTEYNDLLTKYNNETTCVGIASIDDYEDLSSRALPEDKIELVASVEKAIRDWANKTGGLIIKNDRNNFIYVFEKQYLDKMEEERFNILDTVKALDINSKIPITLSIAITYDGKTLYEKYSNAIALMDIVLGRGGDQAVVRKDGKYKFYGGKTPETEKRTKIKARNVAGSLSDAILKSSEVLLMGHKNIDIDAIGSALGLYRLTKSLEKDAYIVTDPENESLGKYWEELTNMEEYEDIIIGEDDAKKLIKDDTLLVVLDTHKSTYVEFPDLLTDVKRKVVIDHHRKSPEYILDTEISYHEVYASSTSELVTELIQYANDNVNLNLIEAESLYGGIMVDTKNFTFKTGVRTFEAAAYLRKFGVDIIRVKKWFQTNFEHYNEIADIVKTSEIVKEGIAVSIYTKESEDGNLICAQAADELLTISDITASFVLGKVGDEIYISGRSVGDINVQVILEKLGGGGHITLAGAQLENCTLDEAHDKLINAIDEYLLENE